MEEEKEEGEREWEEMGWRLYYLWWDDGTLRKERKWRHERREKRWGVVRFTCRMRIGPCEEVEFKMVLKKVATCKTQVLLSLTTPNMNLI